ncbi:MAG: hypothetical protein ABIS86_14715 [Streptosporangiaceae bacterium]
MPLSRRAVLGGALALGLTGCDEKAPEELRAGPEVAILLTAIAGEEQMITLYEGVAAAHPGLSASVAGPLEHHREHLAQLRRHYLPGTGRATPAQTPVLPPIPVPAGRAPALTALRAAEKMAAAARIKDVTQVPPGLAQLFASIGACEAGHAQALMYR